ncbi:hypothetical protein ROZALSC1DRAFT_26775 [Rozella allomycis CSF55]|uniref:Orthogonal Bundle in ATP12 domain-containing protein n=1 Tax=Rozella allomycis (strain CSF55) TaxID=988480 RepID=A0A075AUZ2_ROZAC|nr:Orthogonal Bundle in ATP12 domain-containing protein [Rozella allomycis CSF55]RKP21843.1 hypothetical protein ROZALSC1DRAFT_26775 [Rozella allomycis CSF55]|eukprot:EPZ32537.1 Orthogonal Bundle in ATP12 domain-containing protein [Rozella allomycis CSF55]
MLKRFHFIQKRYLHKRFWKTSVVRPNDKGLYEILLDSKPIKDQKGRPFTLKSEIMANLVSLEWNMQPQMFNPNDIILSKKIMVNDLFRYLDTDTLRYFEQTDKNLVKLQESNWLPLVEWASHLLNTELEVVNGIIGLTSSLDKEIVSQRILNLTKDVNHNTFAAFERAVISSKSMIVGLALVLGKISSKEAIEISLLEINYQKSRWGSIDEFHLLEPATLQRVFSLVNLLKSYNI